MTRANNQPVMILRATSTAPSGVSQGALGQTVWGFSGQLPCWSIWEPILSTIPLYPGPSFHNKVTTQGRGFKMIHREIFHSTCCLFFGRSPLYPLLSTIQETPVPLVDQDMHSQTHMQLLLPLGVLGCLPLLKQRQ